MSKPIVEYPEYVRLCNTEMRLDFIQDGIAHYRRDKDNWGCDAHWVGGRLMTLNPPKPHLEGVSFDISTKEAHDEDNR